MHFGLSVVGIVMLCSACADGKDTAASSGPLSSSSVGSGSGGSGIGGNGGTGGVAGSTNGAAQGGSDAGSGGASADCTFQALAGQHFVESIDPDARVRFFGEVSATERLLVEWFGAVPGVGDYTFSDINYVNCQTCAFIATGCVSDYHPECAQFFFATSGTVSIESYAVGDTLTGSLTDATFVEVTVDWDDTYQSTKVANGATRCIDDFTINAPLEP